MSSTPTPPATNKTRKKGYSRRNADQAKRDIRPDAPPVSLTSDFMRFAAKTRGNARVTINHGFTEVVTSEYVKTIRQDRSTKGLFNNDGQPLNLTKLTLSLGSTLCFAAAHKMIWATPSSSSSDLGPFYQYRNYKLHVPRTYLPVLDLIGKTDYHDWVIRINDNVGTIKRLLLKSISYIYKDVDFEYNHNFLSPEDRAKFEEIFKIPFDHYDTILFDDMGSVKKLKNMAEDFLAPVLKEQLKVKLKQDGNDIEVTFGYPQLPVDRDKPSILAWLGTLNADLHPKAELIGRAGVVLLCDLRWLKQPETPMSQLDEIFRDTPVANVTPRQLLNACELHHFTEFLSERNFIEMTRGVHSFLGNDIVQELRTVFIMNETGSSDVGSPAQLVMPFAEDLHRIGPNNPSYNGLPRKDLQVNAQLCGSFIPYDVGDKVTLSAIINLVDDVEMNPDYIGHFARPLVNIRGQYFSRDGYHLSQQRTFS